jgi:hypothetical protein
MTLPNTNVTLDTPKKKGIAALVLLLTFIVGFAFGKFNNKPNIKIDQKTQTATQQTGNDVQKDVTNVQDQKQVLAAKDENKNLDKSTDVVTTTTTDKKPTGEEITTTKTETKTHVKTSDQTKQGLKEAVKDNSVDKKSDVDNTKTDTQSKTSFQETITQSQPNWRLAAFVGLDTSGLSLSGNALVTGPLLYGGEVDRRILGPIWLGVLAEKTGGGFGIAGDVSVQF